MIAKKAPRIRWSVVGANGHPGESFDGAAILGGVEGLRQLLKGFRSDVKIGTRTLEKLINASPDPRRTEIAIKYGCSGVARALQQLNDWPIELAEVAAEGVVADELGHAPLFEILLRNRSTHIQIGSGIWCLSQGLHRDLNAYRQWLYDKPADGLAEELARYRDRIGAEPSRRGRPYGPNSLRFLEIMGAARAELLSAGQEPVLRDVAKFASFIGRTRRHETAYRDRIISTLADAHASVAALSDWDFTTTDNRPGGSTFNFIAAVNNLYQGCGLVPVASAHFIRKLMKRRIIPPAM